MRIIEHTDNFDEPLRLGYEILAGLARSTGQSAHDFEVLTRIRARQVTNMMAHIQGRFYEAPLAHGDWRSHILIRMGAQTFTTLNQTPAHYLKITI